MKIISKLKLILQFATSFIKVPLYKTIFASFGYLSHIKSPLKIDGGKKIYIGNHVYIAYKCWLASMPLTGETESQLVIEDGCAIGNFNHIYATNSIVLHKDVLTADKVYISDNLHGYEDINIPILRQPIVQNRTVEIGEGSWLGENVCVLGAHIGKHCVIGANSVVTHDIPDYCVAVGAPAKVIKRYNVETKTWEKFKNEECSSENNYEVAMGEVIRTCSYLPHKMRFKKYDITDEIKQPLLITPQFIELEPNVYIGHQARIEGISHYNDKQFLPIIIFREGSSIQQNLHLTCANKIVIGRNTAIAANVTITDIHHPYTDVDTPIEQQDIEVKEVIIGDDCKICNGSVVLPGVHIGKHVTVGANSVVTKDVPDYSVVAGIPAKIIKRYDFDQNKWIRYDSFESHCSG